MLQNLEESWLGELSVVRCLPWRELFVLVLENSSTLILKPVFGSNKRISACEVLCHRVGCFSTHVLVMNQCLLTLGRDQIITVPYGAAQNDPSVRVPGGLLPTCDSRFLFQLISSVNLVGNTVVLPTNGIKGPYCL